MKRSELTANGGWLSQPIWTMMGILGKWWESMKIIWYLLLVGGLLFRPIWKESMKKSNWIFFSQIGSLHPNVGMKIEPKTHISKHQLQFLFRKLEGWIRATWQRGYTHIPNRYPLCKVCMGLIIKGPPSQQLSHYFPYYRKKLNTKQICTKSSPRSDFDLAWTDWYIGVSGGTPKTLQNDHF